MYELSCYKMIYDLICEDGSKIGKNKYSNFGLPISKKSFINKMSECGTQIEW